MTIHYDFPLEGLPSSVRHLCPGGVYLITYDRGAPSTELALATLMNSVTHHPNTTHHWVRSHLDSKQPFTPKVTNLARDALRTGGLRILNWTVTNQSFYLKRLVREFKHFNVKRQGLVVIEQAQNMFPPDQNTQIEAMDVLQSWALDKQMTLVLLAERPVIDDISLIDPSIHHQFAGIAHMDLQNGVCGLNLLHWFGREGSAFRRQLNLVFDQQDGLPHFSLEKSDAEKILIGHEDDENTVWTTSTALMGTALPSGWRVLEESANLNESAHGLRAATVLMHYDKSTQLSELIEKTFQLRQICGNRLRILIREVNAHLRYSHQQILFQAGANMVVPAALNFTQMRNLMGAFSNQLYHRRSEISLGELINLSSAGPSASLVEPPLFASTVLVSVRSSRELAIGNALIFLKPASDDSADRLIDELSLSREGDVYTSITGIGLFIYLPGCQESDVDYTLDRSFRYRWKDLITSESRFVTPDAIEHAIHVLMQNEAPVPITASAPGQKTRPPAAASTTDQPSSIQRRTLHFRPSVAA